MQQCEEVNRKNGEGTSTPLVKVLAQGTTVEGRAIEAVQHDDGSLQIVFDGMTDETLYYRWGAGRIEPCMIAFMRLMRRQITQ